MPFEIIFMDAGQGDATLMVYPNNSLVLVDCGCKKNGEVVSGEIEAVLARYLAVTGNRLRALVLTHPDGDHYNLVNNLIVNKNVQVGKVFIGGSRASYQGLANWFNQLVAQQRLFVFGRGHCTNTLNPVMSYQGDRERVDVRILAANAGKNRNDNSIVLLVTYNNNVNIFLMGDATSVTENHIITTLGNRLNQLIQGRRSVLKAGHHGSATSSSDAWIRKLQPELVFISSDTRSFRGVSLPRSSVIDNVLGLNSIYDYKDNTFRHHYVQYNDNPFERNYQRHEAVPTTLGVFTTLHLLTFPLRKNPDLFISYGTSWYYDAHIDMPNAVTPACGWDKVNKAY